MTVLQTRQLALVLIIGVLIISIYSPRTSPQDIDKPMDSTDNSDESVVAYTQHDTINIASDADFVNQGWPGLGTPQFPYLISNLNISTSITCIQISNTTKHFLIRDCWFYANGVAWEYGIITLDNVINAQIENNYFNGVHSAITAYDSTDCSFSGNFIGTQTLGLYAFNLNSSSFVNNVQTVSEIKYPINIQGAQQVTLRNNSFHRVTSEGIRITLGYDCVIAHNRFQSNESIYIGRFGFLLRDSHRCQVEWNDIIGFDTGLEIQDGSETQVIGNNISESGRGIRLHTTRVSAVNNQIQASFNGIELDKSNSCIIESNDIQGYPVWGIESRVGNNTRIRWNEIHTAGTGILLQGGMDDRIIGNYVYDCGIGISLEENQGTTYEDIIRMDLDRYEWGAPIHGTVVDNTLIDCGISFTITDPAGFDQIIEGNTINGGLLGYFYNWSNQAIEGIAFRQIILAACSEVIVDGGALRGVTLMFCTNSEVRNVNVSQTEYGIHIFRSTGCLVSNTETMSNEIGVYIDQSAFCYVYQSLIHGNEHGILFDESNHSMVYGCEIYQNDYGVVFVGSHGSIIESNDIHTNSEGVFLLRTNDALVGNNDIVYNSGSGILINRLSTGNRIIGNSFGWNAVNALCTAVDNHWDNGLGLGNRWHDYFNDATYVIGGGAGCEDRFPSLLGDGPTIPITTETVTTTIGDIFTPSPIQITIASGMISCILFVALANYLSKRYPR